MRKLMVEYLSDLQSHGVTIARVNSILIGNHLFSSISYLPLTSPQVTSSLAIVFIELSVRIPYLVSYTLSKITHPNLSRYW